MPRGPPPAYDSRPHNVIIFGESGVGKSSVVNLIAGKQVANTSPDAAACTFASKSHDVVVDCKPYRIWDTIGLNEPEMLHEDYLRAIKHAYKLIKSLERSGGVHLLLLCMRGRITNSVQQNYKLFVNVLCEKNIPLGIVVTHLENEESMEEWWTDNEQVFKKYGMSPDGHACITTIPGVEGVFQGRKEESREKMRRLLLDLTVPAGQGWKKDSNVRTWFVNLMGKMMKLLSGRSRRPTNKELVEKLVRECNFSKRDAKVIADSIEKVREQTGSESDSKSESETSITSGTSLGQMTDA